MATALLFGSDTRLYLARPPTGGLTGFNGVQFAAGAASLTNGPEVVAAVNVNSPAPFNKLRRSIFASLCYLELRHVPMLCLDRRVVNRDLNSNGPCFKRPFSIRKLWVRGNERPDLDGGEQRSHGEFLR